MKRLMLGGLIAGAVLGHALMPVDLAVAAPVAHGYAPSVLPQPADPYAPSAAWLAAPESQQAEALGALQRDIGADQTCPRDAAHAYQGMSYGDSGEYEVPSVAHPGWMHLFAPYAPGVCDGPSANGAWQPVGHEFADVLAEGGSKADAKRKWELCLFREGETTWVVCPDGHVVGS